MMSNNAVVHLIDDDEDVRRALAFLLGTAGMMVRIYESGLEFLDAYDEALQGCIVSDVRMPGIDGLELLRRLQEKKSAMPVIVMTGHADVHLAVEAMKAGAVDFIEKPFADEILLDAIRQALERQDRPDQEFELSQVRSRIAALTQREKQVLDGLLAGNPNKVIAYDLGLSPRTVEVHRASMMTKMAAASLSELLRMAILAKMS